MENFTKSALAKQFKLEKEARRQRKFARHQETQAYVNEVTKKLFKDNDKLFQNIGRMMYDKSIFGNKYNCLHHYIRKSQSLNTRWDLENGIPISLKEHCSIHQGQNSELEGKFIQIKGLVWFDKLIHRKHIIINNKLEFAKSENVRLKEIYEKLQKDIKNAGV